MKAFSAVLFSVLCGSMAFSSSAFASSYETISLSKSLNLEIPKELHAHMGFMPSLGGFWFDGIYQKEKFSLWVQRQVPLTMANEFSVNRYWKDGIHQSSLNGEVTQDQGCKAFNHYAYTCKRAVHAAKERFAAETFFWNAKSDMVVVRVMSSKSFEVAEAVAKKIEVKAVSRLPASVKK
jgi:hypothetical protein